MKLSFAAALLGQTIPALSKRQGTLVARDGAFQLTSEIQKATSHRSLILGHDDERRGLRRKRRRGMGQVARNLKNTPSSTVPCDPRSTDADVGILSCGKDHVCKPSITSSLGGVCIPVEANRFDQELSRGSILSSKGPPLNRGTNLVECDPASIDIGILSCGEGKICKHDETSGLGGFCFDTATSDNRRLQTSSYPLEYFLYNCGPFPDDYNVGFSCDCSGLDLATGAGDIKCSQNATADYVQGCDEYVVYNFFTYSFIDSALVKAEDCYETTSPFSESICFNYYFDEQDLACYTEWNDQRCTSCDITYYRVPAFNCSNVDGGRVGDSINEILSVFDLCSNSTCTDLCGEGYFIPDYFFGSNNTGLNYYCQLLSYYEENAVLSDEFCSYVVEGAQLNGCCVPLNYTSSGGDNATIPEEDDEEELDDSTDEGAPFRLLRASQP